MNRALEIGAISQGRYDTSLEQMNAQLAAGATSFGNITSQAQRYNGVAGATSFQTGNIAAQFQDIGVQLAGGQSPFLIALQQGTQLQGVLSQMGGGLRGTFSALGSAFMSLVSPLSLITVGAIAAGGALIQWAFSAGEATEQSKALEEQQKRTASAFQELNDRAESRRLAQGMEETGAASEAEQRIIEQTNQLLAEREALQLKIAELGRIEGGRAQAVAEAQIEINRRKLEGLDATIKENRALLDGEKAARMLSNSAPGPGWMRVAIAETNLLTGQLIKAYAAASSLRAQAQFDRDNDVYSGRGGDPRQFMGGPSQFKASAEVEKLADEMLRLEDATTGGSSGSSRGAARGLKDAADAAEKLRDKMGSPLVSAIGGVSDAFGNFVSSGFKDFKGFTQSILGSFKKMLADMIATALKNRIMISLGIGGAGIAGAANAATGGGGGLLSGLLGGGGGLLSGLGGGGGLLGSIGGLGVLGPIGIVGGILGGLFGRSRKRRQARAAAAQQAAQQAAQEAQSEAQERGSLEQRLLQLQGNTTELRRRELEALRPGNRELQDRIWKLEDEKRISQERNGLETQLLQIQGDTTELRRRELEALDPSNRALQENIWRLEDAADATDKLNQALADLKPEDFATALDFNRARGAMASGISPATAPAAVQASLSAATGGGSDGGGSMTEVLLANINSNIALLWKTVQKFDYDGMPPVRA